jgi:8-hydroxy-5-deazaflavin:NADPH oxidoreductase
MAQATKIAILGAGNVGGNLGERLSRAGFPVRFGVREGADVKELLARCPGASAAGLKEAAAWADAVFIAVPAGAALDAARAAGDLAGKVVIDCNNPLRWEDGPVWAPPPEGSLTAALAKALPGARVVKAFNTFGAEFHKDPRVGDAAADVQIAGDDATARAEVAKIAAAAGFSPIDAGPLRNAAVLENLAVLWIHLAMKGGQGRGVVFKLLKR